MNASGGDDMGGRRLLDVAVRRLRVRIAPPAIRLGIVACVGIACLIGAARLDDTIAVFDDRADRNAAATLRQRVYPESTWVAGDAGVIQDARLWMSDDASYRVMHGPTFDTVQYSGYGKYFLLGLLLPRAQTDSLSARWVFCYGCDVSTLGPRLQVLSDSRDGFVFARLRR